ncbi:MAG: SlyX family protein [Amaricoccus sp.]
MSAEDRLVAIESALAHQERLVEELNALVREQADRIALIQAQLRYLAGRLAEAEAALPDTAAEANVPPPHW